ncbi:MAG: WD40/YVTN/BNR-like repeat-containing protein [Terriglobales bacterium]
MTRQLPLAALVIALALPLAAQQINPAQFSGMRWRLIGPFRAGRVSAVTGVAGDPATYYIGTPGGGVWKSTSGGEVWRPIFDQEPVESIGAIAVAPSNPQVVYVGTGDVDNVGGSVNQGDGIYKTTDGGATWQHLGLDATRHIAAIWVDPHNPDLVLVAALGRTYASNPERGVYRSSDGGRNWQQVLYKGPAMGAISLAADADQPNEVFAALESHAPSLGGRGRRAALAAPGAGIYKSLDEGATWTPVGGDGLPARDLGRIGLAVAAHSQGKRVYAITAAGLYRSDDSGERWSQATTDRRIAGSSYFSVVAVAPDNPDVVYVCQTSLYRSTDGGHTFEAFKGAPGGDDYHEVWIDPANSRRLILGVDQGATISLNGGAQWSLGWYNLPNGQFYHIAVDNRFPYWVFGTEQDSGSAAVASRGDFGEITFMDWLPSVGAYEFGYIHPDLSDPNFVFATGGGTALNRYDMRTKQILDISPPQELPIAGVPARLRFAGSPQAVSPQDAHVFYLGAQAVLATRDRGLTWQAVSPDLTGGGRGAITAFAPSAARAGEMWVGTSDGKVQMTAGGQSWKVVTPAALPASAPIESLEASPTEPGTAYVVAERHTQNDFAPYIFRTRDGGASWQPAIGGLPADDFVRVVRADPKRAGLLYAGTEHGVFVSFDHGNAWQPLQLNLPPASVRDLAVHGDDLVAATYGRALWILDDLTPLRQLDAGVGAAVTLFRPETAIRTQPDVNYDTPFPPEMPTGTNPPAGAIVDYDLAGSARSVALGVYDSGGHLIRRLTNVEPPPQPAPQLDIPNYWLARPQPLPSGAGMHRVAWDLRYDAPPAFETSQPIAALLHDTPTDPRGPFVVPGTYELRLTVDGQTYRQPLRVVEDPRITTSPAGLGAQRDLALAIAAGMRASYAGKLTALNTRLGSLLTLIELSDDAPTAVMRQRYGALCRQLGQALAAQPGAPPAPACQQ